MKQIKKIKGYKAFTKNLTCRGMQYEIGEIYEVVRKAHSFRGGMDSTFIL